MRSGCNLPPYIFPLKRETRKRCSKEMVIESEVIKREAGLGGGGLGWHRSIWRIHIDTLQPEAAALGAVWSHFVAFYFSLLAVEAAEARFEMAPSPSLMFLLF